jgi:Icc-related predicted phosphoesterase
VVGIAGNHDWFAVDHPGLVRALPWTYLQDSGVELEGLRIWGSPWTLPFRDWAFMMGEEGLAGMCALVPNDTEILLTHGPPFGLADKTRDGVHAGSKSLAIRVGELPDLQLHVFGHVHEGGGMWGTYDERGMWANVAILTENYQRRGRACTVIDL